MSALPFQGGIILRTFVPVSVPGLRLSLVNETHKKPYTGPKVDENS